MQHGAELFFRFLDQLRDYALIALDPDGRVVHWNQGAEELLGYDAEEMTAQSIERIFTPEDRQLRIPEIEYQRAQVTGRSIDERFHLKKNGGRFWASGVLVACREEDGRLLGFGKILRDRSDARQHMELLRGQAEACLAIDERRRSFLASVAHELRGPLSPLGFAVEMLRQRHAADPELVAGMIERQTNTLRRLVDDLLDSVRLSWGKFELRTAPLELNAVVQAAVDSIADLAARHDHAVTLSPAPQRLMILADADRLHQVFTNLLTNAVKYTPDGGRIDIALSQEDGEALVEIVDSGLGLDPAQLEHVFELFTRAHVSEDRDSPNLGLGLAIVHELLLLHEGSIQAQSDGPGKGTRFVVRLPLLRRGPDGAGAPHEGRED